MIHKEICNVSTEGSDGMGLKINDVDVKETYRFVVTDVTGRGSPPIQRITLEDLSFDGALEESTKFSKRELTITGYVYGSSPSNARSNKDALISFISQGYTDDLKITFPDSNRSIFVRLNGTPITWQAQGPALNAIAYNVVLNFVAFDPFFYGGNISPTLGTGMVKLSTEAPLYLVDPRRALYKREPKLQVYPITVVNLLGKLGDFETDSEGYGLGDGWDTNFDYINTELSTDKVVIGDKSQYLWVNTWVGKQIALQNRSFQILTGHTYFISLWMHTNQEIAYRYVAFPIGDPITHFEGNTTLNRFNKNYCSHTATRDEQIWLFFYRTDSETGRFSLWIDGFMVIDLTAMGILPLPLKEYFNGPQLWKDLATSSNITAIDGKVQSGNAWLNELLPYVNSVATLGYTFGL